MKDRVIYDFDFFSVAVITGNLLVPPMDILNEIIGERYKTYTKPKNMRYAVRKE